jgi:hypothetical protein
MDPLSITVSVLTLITISAQVSGLARQFRDEVNVVDTTLNGILNDVDGFQQVLESMKETFDQKDIRGDLRTTGHVGSHWNNLSRSLSDGENTLEQLRSLIVSVSRSAKFLDAPRKHLRFKSAIAQIAEFREQIQSYRAALQLSLSTVILYVQRTEDECMSLRSIADPLVVGIKRHCRKPRIRYRTRLFLTSTSSMMNSVLLVQLSMRRSRSFRTRSQIKGTTQNLSSYK